MSFYKRAVCGGSALVFAVPASLLAAGIVLAVIGLAIGYNHLPVYLQWGLTVLVASPFVLVGALVAFTVVAVLYGMLGDWWVGNYEAPTPVQPQYRLDSQNRIIPLEASSTAKPRAKYSMALAMVLLVEPIGAVSLIYWLKPVDNLPYVVDMMTLACIVVAINFSRIVVAIWNKFDKRGLPTQDDRRLAAAIACIGGQAVIAGLFLYLGVPSSVFTFAAIIGIGVAFIPVSLALYYQCDETGLLTRIFKRSLS